jgi:peptidoglycan-associated lipoprotein
MKCPYRILPLAALLAMSCAQKPKPAAETGKAPSAVATMNVPSTPGDSSEQHRLRIENLLNEAFRPVYFPFDQASLSEASKRLLGQAGDLMKREPSIKVLIQGNTDERGTEEYNLALGYRRARVVRDYLVSYGVEGSRLKLISYGEEKPAKPGHDESAWAANRRDEFNVTF